MFRRQTKGSRFGGGRELIIMMLVVLVVFMCLAFVPTPPFSTMPRSHGRRRPGSRPHRVHDTSRWRLLLSTQGRIFWYDPRRHEEHALYDREGVYYGTFPGEDPQGERGLQSIWVVSRPNNWHGSETREWLLHLDAKSGQEIERVEIPSKYTQDAVRAGKSVWVCNTGQGELLQYSYPDMQLKRTFPIFHPQDHVNTIAVIDSKSIWVVLDKFGDSMVLEVDQRTGAIIRRIENVGQMVHGLVDWNGLFVMLDSQHGDLITLDPNTGRRAIKWRGGKGINLKGLAVVDDIAYFGISPAADEAQHDHAPHTHELAAVSLPTSTLLFRRLLNTTAPLNMVTTPTLTIHTPYFAIETARLHNSSDESDAIFSATGDFLHDADDAVPHEHPPSEVEASAASTAVHVQPSHVVEISRLTALNPKLSPPPDPAAPLHLIGGHWSTGLPFLNIALKGKYPGEIPESVALAKLQLRLGPAPPDALAELQDVLYKLPEAYWDPHDPLTRKATSLIADRDDNMISIKPGVNSIQLLFSTSNGKRIWQLPMYDYFKDSIEKLLHAVIGKEAMARILRLQFARMLPGAHIKLHKDTGRWCQVSHRIHIVLVTNNKVTFKSCSKCLPRSNVNMTDADYIHFRKTSPDCNPNHASTTCTALEVPEGDVFEVDNLVRHSVENHGDEVRIHLVVDVAEDELMPRVILKPGHVCHYSTASAGIYEAGC